METLILLLMCCVCLNFVVKISFFRKFWQILPVAVVCGLFLWIVMPQCITQSKTQIADFLANTRHMLNMSVIITLEAVLAISYCFLTVQNKLKKWQKIVQKALHFFVGILIFVVLFYAETQTIFSLPGTSFTTISLVLAITIPLLIVLLWFLFRYLIDDNEMRLELYFFGNLLMIFLGIICTVNGQTAVKGVVSVDWKSFLFAVSVMFLGAVIGLILYKRKLRIKN